MLTRVWAHSILCIACAVFTCFSVTAKQPDIHFGIAVAPPFHIPPALQQAHQLPEGLCDALITAVKTELPALSVQVSRLPQIRIRQLMKRQQNLCFPCLIKRSSYNPDYYFSDTTHLYAPHGIITRKALAEQLIKKYGSPISFAALAAESQLGFAQPSGRKYGDIQPIIEQHLMGTPHYRAVFGQNASFNLLSMIATERVDYTIDYQMIMNFYRRLGGAKTPNASPLAFIPIKEYANQPIVGAIGCARNAWGEQAIEKMNAVLPEIKSDKNFIHSLDFWLGERRPKIQ